MLHDYIINAPHDHKKFIDRVRARGERTLSGRNRCVFCWLLIVCTKPIVNCSRYLCE